LMAASEINQQKRINLDGALTLWRARSVCGRDGGGSRVQLRDGHESTMPNSVRALPCFPRPGLLARPRGRWRWAAMAAHRSPVGSSNAPLTRRRHAATDVRAPRAPTLCLLASAGFGWRGSSAPICAAPAWDSRAMAGSLDLGPPWLLQFTHVYMGVYAIAPYNKRR
jgi:hypothetical protein